MSITLDLIDDERRVMRLPVAQALSDAPLKYASRLYPVYEQDVYSASSIPTAISSRNARHKASEKNAYNVLSMPTAIKIRSILQNVKVDDAYSVSSAATAIKIKNPLFDYTPKSIAYKIESVPISVTSKKALIRYYKPRNDAYVISSKPISIKVNKD